MGKPWYKIKKPRDTITLKFVSCAWVSFYTKYLLYSNGSNNRLFNSVKLSILSSEYVMQYGVTCK